MSPDEHRRIGRSAVVPILLAVVTLTLAGCASAGTRLADEHRTPMSAPFDMLWAELEPTYRDLGIPIAQLPTREPVIRSGDVGLDVAGLVRDTGRDLVRCPRDEGEPGPAPEKGVFIRVVTRLEQEGSTADVVTDLEAWRTDERGRRRSCRSTGALERQIADELRRRV